MLLRQKDERRRCRSFASLRRCVERLVRYEFRKCHDQMIFDVGNLWISLNAEGILLVKVPPHFKKKMSLGNHPRSQRGNEDEHLSW